MKKRMKMAAAVIGSSDWNDDHLADVERPAKKSETASSGRGHGCETDLGMMEKVRNLKEINCGS